MVTVELVFGMVIISTLVVVFGWAIMLFAIQVGCVDTATQVARQAARGDQEAVQRAKDRAPRGAEITVRRGAEQVRVTVRVSSRPTDWVPPVTLRASVSAQLEPGE